MYTPKGFSPASTAIVASVENSPNQLNAVHVKTVLVNAAREISSVGDRYFEKEFGTDSLHTEKKEEPHSLTRGEKIARFEGAMEARNRDKVFLYHTGSAFLVRDRSMEDEKEQNAARLFTRRGKFDTDAGKPFTSTIEMGTDRGNFNALLSAYMAMLSWRQYGSRAPNGYPLTFFVGPTEGGNIEAHARLRKNATRRRIWRATTAWFLRGPAR